MNIAAKDNQPKRLPVIEVKEISWQKAHLFFSRSEQSIKDDKKQSK